MTPEQLLRSIPRRRDWAKSVRTSLDARRVLRELANAAAVMAITTTTVPQTTEDVAALASRIARELVP